MKKTFYKYLPYAIVFFVAVVLRLLYIDTAIWYDEACSWFSAKQAFPSGIMDILLHLDLQHTPIYFFILHFWMKMFGDGEIALRGLSFLFSIASIPLAYVIARKLANKKVALALISIVAASPLLVFFSVEIRMYPLVVLLVLLSFNALIDFEQKGRTKSLVQLVFYNLLIPYTLVGGILYNISLVIGYGGYLYKEKRAKFKRYFKSFLVEIFLLVPYFVLIVYYWKIRSLFVIKHEGIFAFWHFVEVIRNFFSPNIVSNPYWPSVSNYDMTLAFFALIIAPCAYFLYGYIKGFIKSYGFVKCLYCIFLVTLLLAVLFGMLQVNVFTTRYVLFLLIPMMVLSLRGLYKSLSKKHFVAFVSFFVLASIWYTVADFRYLKVLKQYAFADVKTEADELGLTSQDVVIMPFGSDAPYYFRKINAPKVHKFDIHKELRNPYNNNFYDISQQKLMDKEARYSAVYDAVFKDDCFSENFRNYFTEDVNSYVDSGRFVLLALYSDDASAVVHINDLRNSISNIKDIKNNMIMTLMKKYLFDVQYLLTKEFQLVKSYQKNNYTYYLFQKM